MGLVVPAVLPSSRKDLEEKLAFLSQTSVNRVQIDVVDGRFASPASWPYTAPKEFDEMVRSTRMLPYLDRFAYEVDLMCLDAEPASEAWLTLGATRLTFHAESARNPERLLASARRRFGSGRGFAPTLLSFGLALNIDSDLALIENCLEEVEYIQFMGIAQIGQQGQPFDTRILEKLRMFRSYHPEIAVQVDGGVTLANAKQLLTLGVSSIVVGSAIVRARDPIAAVEMFEALQSPYGV